MLLPLLRNMLAEDPAQRPSAADALQHFRAIRRKVTFVQRIWRPRERNEPLVVTILSDFASLVRGSYLHELHECSCLFSALPLSGTFSDSLYALYNISCIQRVGTCTSIPRCFVEYVSYFHPARVNMIKPAVKSKNGIEASLHSNYF